MMKNQPSPISSSVTTLDRWGTGPRTAVDSDRFVADVRLVGRWLDLVRRSALVAAHGTLGGSLPSEEDLLDLLAAAETAIVERLSGGQALLDGLVDWEVSLMHEGLMVDPVHCLVCRRAQDVPEGLPAKYAWALPTVGDSVGSTDRKVVR